MGELPYPHLRDIPHFHAPLYGVQSAASVMAVAARVPVHRAEGLMVHRRILLADAHPALLHRLEELLACDFDVVGTVSNAPALLEAARARSPHVILVDVSLPPGGGFEAIRQVRLLLPEVKVLLLSFHDDPGYAEKARQVGALGLLLKQHPARIAPFIRGTLLGHEAGSDAC